MLALIQLLLITSQKGKIPKVEDIVGEWISTPGWSTNYHTAVFMADGTYEDKDRKGKWYIEGKDVFVGGEKKGEGTRYRYTQNGRALMQYAFDSQAYIRKSTLDIEHNIEGIWSIDANPKAGPPTGKNFIIRLYVDKGHKGYLDLDLDVGRNSVPIKLPSGKTITLFPSKDFNQFSEKAPGGVKITRVPMTPINEAILGKWSCGELFAENRTEPLIFSGNGTYSYRRTEGTWEVEGGEVVVHKFKGTQTLRLKLSNSGLSMRTGWMTSGTILMR